MVRSFELYSTASGCPDDRKRELFLHSAGPEVQDIFDTLTNTGETYGSAKKSLTDHFAPEENIPFSRHLFGQEKQRDGETISQLLILLGSEN